MQVHLWNLGFIKDKTKGKYKEIEDKISDALAFMQACGINSDNNRRLRTVNFYTSHEALLLPFEEAMTRVDSQPENIMIHLHTLFGLVTEQDNLKVPMLNFVEELKIR